jgi:hypothetical protein
MIIIYDKNTGRIKIKIIDPNKTAEEAGKQTLGANEGFLEIFEDFNIVDYCVDTQTKQLLKKPYLIIEGDDTIPVNQSKTYVVKKYKGDDTLDNSATDLINISITRGLLSILSGNLVNGQLSFSVTAPNETITSTIVCKSENILVKNERKTIQFVP